MKQNRTIDAREIAMSFIADHLSRWAGRKVRPDYAEDVLTGLQIFGPDDAEDAEAVCLPHDIEHGIYMVDG